MIISDWLSNNWIEIFGAVAGIIYVFLEIKQKIWLWPVGIITSAVYIIVFFTSKFYADMGLQGYYLVISCVGWYWWVKGGRRQAEGGRIEESGKGKHEDDNIRPPSLEGPVVGFEGTKRRRDEGTKRRRDEGTERRRDAGTKRLAVTRLKLRIGIILLGVFILLYFLMWFVLSRMTDSPVPEWDSFITSLSVVATWMLAKKIYEHWYLWIAVNLVAVIIFFTRDLYPTAILYLVYLLMSFAGLKEWEKSL